MTVYRKQDTKLKEPLQVLNVSGSKARVQGEKGPVRTLATKNLPF